MVLISLFVAQTRLLHLGHSFAVTASLTSAEASFESLAVPVEFSNDSLTLEVLNKRRTENILLFLAGSDEKLPSTAGQSHCFISGNPKDNYACGLAKCDHISHFFPACGFLQLMCNKQSTAKNKNKQTKTRKVDPTCGNVKTKWHNGICRRSPSYYSSEREGLNDSNKCRIVRLAREQKRWNQKKNEEWRKSEHVEDEWLEKTRHALSSSGLRCDVASKESDPGSGQGWGLTPLWPQPEHEKGHNEWTPGMSSKWGINTGTLKTEWRWENRESLFKMTPEYPDVQAPLLHTRQRYCAFITRLSPQN